MCVCVSAETGCIYVILLAIGTIFRYKVGRVGVRERLGDGHQLYGAASRLQESHSYKFRMIAENANGVSEPLECEEPVVAKNPYDPPSAPSKLEVADRDRTHIDLKWQPPESDGGAPITCCARAKGGEGHALGARHARAAHRMHVRRRRRARRKGVRVPCKRRQ